MNISTKKLCENLPTEIYKVIDYIRNLAFD